MFLVVTEFQAWVALITANLIGWGALVYTIYGCIRWWRLRKKILRG